jgi:hypothetical protein
MGHGEGGGEKGKEREKEGRPGYPEFEGLTSHSECPKWFFDCSIPVPRPRFHNPVLAARLSRGSVYSDRDHISLFR